MDNEGTLYTILLKNHSLLTEEVESIFKVSASGSEICFPVTNLESLLVSQSPSQDRHLYFRHLSSLPGTPHFISTPRTCTICEDFLEVKYDLLNDPEPRHLFRESSKAETNPAYVAKCVT